MGQICDLCGGKSNHLVSLRECYATTEIKEICTECETIVNKKCDSFKFDFAAKLLKAWMRNVRQHLIGDR